MCSPAQPDEGGGVVLDVLHGGESVDLGAAPPGQQALEVEEEHAPEPGQWTGLECSNCDISVH